MGNTTFKMSVNPKPFTQDVAHKDILVWACLWQNQTRLNECSTELRPA